MTTDKRLILRGLVLIATLVAAGLLFEVLGLKDMFQSGWIDAEVRGKGLAGESLFLLVGAVFVALGLPRQAVCFMGGYAFGFAAGSGLGLVATLAGSLVTFWYARFMGRDFMLRRFPGKLKKVDDFLVGNTFMMALVLRLSPLSANVAANLAAGVSGVRTVPFFTGSTVGYLPQTLIFALLGSGFEVAPVMRTTASAALFVVSTLLGLWLWRRYRTAKGLPEEA